MKDFQEFAAVETARINSALSAQVDKMDPAVREVAAYCLEAGGKRLRGLLVLLCGRATASDRADLYRLACALEMLHAATLLHDDVVDSAGLRRGRPAAHKVFSPAAAVLAGDVMLAEASLIIAEFGRIELVACLSKAISRTATGEVKGLSLKGVSGMTMDEYTQIITGKTACLMEAACASAAMLCGAPPELERRAAEFGLSLGIAYQMIDDALDYSDSGRTGKTHGNDLAEGMPTLPFILLLQSLPARKARAAAELFARGNLSVPEREELLSLARELCCDRQTRQAAEEYLRQAEAALSFFPESKEKGVLLQAIDFVRWRSF